MRAKENIGRAKQIAQNELKMNESLTKIQSTVRNKNAKAKLNRKAERQKKADGLSKLLSQENQQNELNDVFETDRQISAANKIKNMIKLKQDEPRRHALEQGIKGAQGLYGSNKGLSLICCVYGH